MASTDAQRIPRPATGSQPTSPRLAPADKVTITVLLLSAFVVILNETAMNVALDAIIDDLGITERLAQWLTTGFLLTMAVVIPTTGFLIQRFPLRTLFFTAMGLFTLGTVIAAIAPGFGVLLLGRVVHAREVAEGVEDRRAHVLEELGRAGHGQAHEDERLRQLRGDPGGRVGDGAVEVEQDAAPGSGGGSGCRVGRGRVGCGHPPTLRASRGRPPGASLTAG